LVRLPNVFTAFADIALGLVATLALAGSGLPALWWFSYLALFIASGCLYAAGMVFNDIFDAQQDRRERPFRPIPSGRVSRTEATRLGLGLLVAGLIAACLSGWHEDAWSWTPAAIGSVLASVILLYDAWLKRTWAGPVGMGLCRFLNILLGLSVWTGPLTTWGWHVAAVVGIYIVGVTWFARTEARASKPSALKGGAAVMLAGILLELGVPLWLPAGTTSPLFPYLVAGLICWVGMPVCRAIARPKPDRVQTAVKCAIFGLVALDATLATALAGSIGLIILLLLVPAQLLGRRIYST
jgi:4-hydroxybenzoate polyprenyltransferase